MNTTENANTHNKKEPKKILFFLVPVTVIVALLVFYYRHKLTLMVSNPSAFFDLFLSITQLKNFTVYTILTTLALSGVVFIIDLIVEGWDGSALRKLVVNPSNSSKIDLFCYFLAVTRIFQILQLCFSLGIAYFLASLFFHYCNVNIMGKLKVPYLQPILVFILLDFKHYLEHRFMHLPKLWELHAYHHSATEFTIFTNARGHLLEESVYFVFTGLFFAIMGPALHELFYFYAFREIYGSILHADIKSNFGFVGKWILMSPPAHKLHHSIKKEDYGRNFGTLFIWWDKLFGTYKEPSGDIKIGLHDDFYNQMGFFKGQWIGFKRWINSW